MLLQRPGFRARKGLCGESLQCVIGNVLHDFHGSLFLRGIGGSTGTVSADQTANTQAPTQEPFLRVGCGESVLNVPLGAAIKAGAAGAATGEAWP